MSDKSWLEKCKNYLKYSAMDARGNRIVIVHEEDFRKLLARVVELEVKFMSEQEMLKEARDWLGFITKIEAGMNEHVKGQRMKVLAWLIGQAEQNKRYREALEFYADEENWIAALTSVGDFPCEVEEDQGEKARKALEGENE